MSRNRILILFFGMMLFSYVSAQSSFRERSYTNLKDTLLLDSLSIYPNSLSVFCGDTPLTLEDYYIDHGSSKFVLTKPCAGEIRIRYRVLPFNFSKIYAKRDTSLMYVQNKGDMDPFRITTFNQVEDVFGGSSLTKSGSISRGVSFGNNQDLGVNSTLNLELSGNITPNLKVLASLSDDNLPIQADGNTNKLQEFDKIFIQIYNDRLKVIAGDFWLYRPKGYFMNYKKRAQGLNIEYLWGTDTTKYWKTQVSGAFSKGKFARQIITGIEGNQGPYRLRGNENEPFIIVLSGTERVYIDGKLLERGQEFDYTINYNSAEVIFTARNQITKDSRIVVEFQYSDQNYARSLFQASQTYTSEKFNFWLNAYSEQDAKNQSLQQSLSAAQKTKLAEIGDSLYLAQISSIDSIGFVDNQNMYKMIDSLGYDSVLVFSVSQDSAFFKATFQYVGPNKGNYVLANYNALGRVFKWVVPVGGVPQGDYQPSRLLITPKKRQMLTMGANYKINRYLELENEVAYTKNDINTFSRKDQKDDQSFANKTKMIATIPLSKDSLPIWSLKTKLELEALEKNFVPIEQYRAVEFDRDWNTRNKGYTGNQLASSIGTNFIHRNYGNLNLEGQQFLVGEDYQGYRMAADGRWNQKGFRADWNASYLSSQTEQRNDFLRHKIEVSKDFKFIKLGYKDDHERNNYEGIGIPLATNSYQFFDYQFYLANGDSIKNNWKLFYRERYDQRSDSTRLVKGAKATTVGGELRLTQLQNQTLGLMGSYRELKIHNSILMNQAPENSVLGRIEYEFRFFKQALTWNSFYEVGSGLELRREFQYLKVNDGQGIYTWIDYNGDGIKDLNEFEIAQFVDQASYIRVFTPSNEYTKTYSNEFNQSFFWKPERLWASKKGVLKVLSLFSNQTRLRLYRKTSDFAGASSFNPFVTTISDTSLIASTLSFRNTLYFNRISSVFSAEYSIQNNQNKSLLASGFDAKEVKYQELNMRWNIIKWFTVECKNQYGFKLANADYTTNRNYHIAYYFIQPSFILQPNTLFRISLDGKISEKKNEANLGGELSKILELGTQMKWNQAENGSLQGGFKMIRIEYDGIQNSALGFEMLEALKPGINYTWNIGYQRSLSKNLQLSFQYNGRKSENNRVIHSAGMEVRAFF